ncbi:unnamed protein product [Symbiodinium natans]|uniref:Uncharacterized protein n=1 Tax=Symbiodinium natans TaxID=878477 RepID=A0A812SVW1_9DINO|nr:unnamed protein product [Symbiodinium natans]
MRQSRRNIKIHLQQLHNFCSLRFCAAKVKLKHRALTLPSLRGGLLIHALKKIKDQTGVLSCELQYLDYGAEVVIDGQPGNVLNCEEAVLRVAEGNVDGLDFVEIRHEVSMPAGRKLQTGKAKKQQTPAQAIGCMTGAVMSVIDCIMKQPYLP